MKRDIDAIIAAARAWRTYRASEDKPTRARAMEALRAMGFVPYASGPKAEQIERADYWARHILAEN
ncbi:MAG: hypothetical protein AB7R40_23290 [Nitrospiraceae bacterium]